MMAALAPSRPMDFTYDSSVFASIPSLEEAHDSISSNPCFEMLLSEFAEIATKSGYNDLFGLTLVHRHTSVGSGKRLLDLKQTLQPFPLADDAKDLHGCPIRPKSFALVDGLWKPYEYELGELGQAQDAEASFFGAVKRRIEGLGLTNIGLRRYLPSDPEELEVTESGGISVKVPLTLIGNYQDPEYTTTFWAYPSGAPKNYRGHCRNNGSTHDDTTD